MVEIDKLNKIEVIVKNILNNIKNNKFNSYNFDSIKSAKDDIIDFAYSIKNENLCYHQKLLDVKDKLFLSNGTVNLYQLGRLKEIVDSLVEKNKEADDSFWNIINKKITSVCRSKFEDGYYADAVESALKEVEVVLKGEFRQQKLNEKVPFGSDLMNRMFSISNPMLKFEDLSTDSGRDVQIGYMQIFSGAMTGIRNPKAHENLTISREDAIHKLFLASLLMNKVEQALYYANGKAI